MIRRSLSTALLAGLGLAAGLGLTACGAGAAASAGTGPAAVRLASESLVDAGDSTSGSGDVPAAGRCTAQQRWTALAQVAPQVEAYLTDHPDVAAEIDHLRSLPVGERRAEAATWIAAHPQYQPQVEALRARLQHYRETCSVG